MQDERSPRPGLGLSADASPFGTALLEIVVADPLITIIPAHILTPVGDYWMATNGGGIGSGDSGASATALRTDSLIGGEYETFTIEIVNFREFALKTSGGFYVTAVGGGGVLQGGHGIQPILTNGRASFPDARFYFRRFGKDQVRIKTADDKHYITAVNGGGFVGNDQSPFRTDAKTAGPTEKFSFDGLNKSQTHNGPA